MKNHVSFQPFYKMDPGAALVPLSKTPWAGHVIADIKQSVCDPVPFQRIGESYEISVDPQFPSWILDASVQQRYTLTEALQQMPQHMLGAASVEGFSLLLKWIQAAQVLSVQVHPHHQHPLLEKGMCGKPEAWYVAGVCAQTDDAVLYLGWKPGVLQKDIEDALLTHRSLEPYLFSYKPQVGDYIFLPTGCVHALGAGVFVIEPQQVLPGCSGQTWRLYDWQRKYNAQGELDPNKGEYRPLHIQQALSAIDWTLPRGPDFLQHFVLKTQSEQQYQHCVNNVWKNPFKIVPFLGAGSYQVDLNQRPMCVTVWSGRVQLRTSTATCCVNAGESVFVSAATQHVQCVFEHETQALCVL